MKIITLEEHFSTPAILKAAARGAEAGFGPMFHALGERLTDLTGTRIAAMDEAGVDLQVVSINAHELPPEATPDLFGEANDILAAATAAHPTRLAGFAALPTTTPEAAAAELTRAVTRLGFKGAAINGTVQGHFLDHASFEPLLATAEHLDVPLYLHPNIPLPAVTDAYYSGFDPAVSLMLSTAAWGWHMETGLHAIRLVLAGVFDRHPRLQIIIGHMGEYIPFSLDRTKERISQLARNLQRPYKDYFLQNIHYTTSGVFTNPPLLCALAVLGADRMMFSVDYPYSDNKAGTDYLRQMPISDTDREKIAGLNAEKLLRL